MEPVFAQALAAIVRSELGRVDITAAEAQRRIGVSSSSWQNYFKTQDRDVPTWVLLALCGLFDRRLSEFWALVEEQVERSQAAGPVSAPAAVKVSGADRRRAKAAEKGRALLEAETPGITTRRKRAQSADPAKKKHA